jgi:hypothetical protein
MPETRSESNSESNKNNIGTHFSPLLKRKKLLIRKIYINNVYVQFYCASNEGNIIFYICISIELCLIKGQLF